MSIQACYFCVQDVEKCDFECVDRYQCCVIFTLSVFQAVFLLFLAVQRRLRHMGSARFFDYHLHRITRACLLCIFVPPPTAPLHYVGKSGSFLWSFSLFIYFVSISGLSPEANFHIRGPRLF